MKYKYKYSKRYYEENAIKWHTSKREKDLIVIEYLK